MRRAIVCGLVMAILATGCAAPRQPVQLPTYSCMHIEQRVRIDGRLDEEQWQQADPISLVLTDTGRTPTISTVAKMLWNDTFLYVAFVCEDQNIQAQMTHADDDLWLEDEVVEVFFSPGPEVLAYYEFEVNPQNARIDLSCEASSPDGQSKECDKEWNCIGWYSGVAIDGTLNNAGDSDRRWTCEIAIPFESICPDRLIRSGETWRLNLYRINRVPGGVEYAAWSPTGAINFHVPGRFGVCQFVKGSVAGAAAIPAAASAGQ